MNPPITPPIIKFSANSVIPPPKELLLGTIQRHIRWRPKGSTLFRKNVLIVSLLVIRQTSFHTSIIQNDPDGAQGMEKIICEQSANRTV